MSATITIEEAQAKLKELIDQLAPAKKSSSPRTSSRWRSWWGNRQAEDRAYGHPPGWERA